MGYLSSNILNIINEKPDVVIFGFGMNDHIIGNIDGQQEYFVNTYSNTIKQLKENNITKIILFGFPQQNIDWIKEDINQTIIYNSLIKDIAKNNDVGFVDIYSVFNNVKNKSLNEDIYGDYMHHPSSFGHKIYASALIPYFIQDDVFDYRLVNYIKIKDEKK